MPKRMIDDSLLDSRSLEVLSPVAQDQFPRFILLADDFGCFEINPTILRARGWSRRPEVTDSAVEGWLIEYAERQATDPDTGEKLPPVLMAWTHVGRRYGFLTGWFGPHGQKRRAEYDPQAPAGTPGRHGSKRRTPAPPADLLAAVMAGNVRAVDGKPPGTDREPTGNEETGNPNNSTPAREPTGNLPGSDRDAAGKCQVPAPAVPGAVAVPVPAAPHGGLPFRFEKRQTDYPHAAALHLRLAEEWDPFGWTTDPEIANDAVKRVGLDRCVRSCLDDGRRSKQRPKSLGFFSPLLATLRPLPPIEDLTPWWVRLPRDRYEAFTRERAEIDPELGSDAPAPATGAHDPEGVEALIARYETEARQ